MRVNSKESPTAFHLMLGNLNAPLRVLLHLDNYGTRNVRTVYKRYGYYVRYNDVQCYIVRESKIMLVL